MTQQKKRLIFFRYMPLNQAASVTIDIITLQNDNGQDLLKKIGAQLMDTKVATHKKQCSCFSNLITILPEQ